MEIGQEYFGPLARFVADESITDIDFNGRDLWLTDWNNCRYRVDRAFTESYLTPSFIEQFSQKIANLISKQFNKRNPRIEAETPELRITLLHESAARSGRAFSIRKTPPIRRITIKRALEEGYCEKKILAVLINCVKTQMNFTFCGVPGAGKTESLKFFAGFIPEDQRVITIEDTMEIRYSATRPEADCIEMKISEPLFGYTEALKTCLRLNPRWIMLSEARSVEVKYLLESWSTGVRGMTTLHTDDVRKIPDRVLNMMESRNDADRLENDIYQALDVGILVRRKIGPDGKMVRRIEQVCFFDRYKGINEIILAVSGGEWILKEFPETIRRNMLQAGIGDPFRCPELEGM